MRIFIRSERSVWPPHSLNLRERESEYLIERFFFCLPAWPFAADARTISILHSTRRPCQKRNNIHWDQIKCQKQIFWDITQVLTIFTYYFHLVGFLGETLWQVSSDLEKTVVTSFWLFVTASLVFRYSSSNVLNWSALEENFFWIPPF